MADEPQEEVDQQTEQADAAAQAAADQPGAELDEQQQEQTEAASGPQQPEAAVVEVPAVVSRHEPALAAVWSHLSEEAQQAALDVIAGRIDRGEPQADEQRAAPVPQKERQAPVERQPPAAGDIAIPEPFDAADLEAIRAAFDLDEKATNAVAKLARLATWAADSTQEIGRKALEALEEGGKTTQSLADKWAMEEAQGEYRRELGAMTPKARQQVIDRAREYKGKGRVETFSDAIWLAMREVRRSATAPAATKKAELAAAMGSPGRRGGQPVRRKTSYGGDLSAWLQSL